MGHISEQERRIMELEALIAAAHRKAEKTCSETSLEPVGTGSKTVAVATPSRRAHFITTIVPLFLLGGLSTVYFLQKK